MKLNDLMIKPLKEVVEECNVVNIKNITDDKGTIIKVIVEYTPKDFAPAKNLTDLTIDRR
ncbi:hypothetical protein 10S11_69 [uncultured Caudovirales phage]|uniref:Uncharacterized protein n=1 Tax=uncultured Caudovirales phage TaxID=2100421 RepID=A0A2H4J8C4_9CAUD|nr:hypothetical protein 10S11_69 [uncultured Caudovirales phage]